MNNKLIGKSLALLLGVFAAQALFAADYSDYVSLRGTGLTAIDAFMTNVVDTTKGWSDELDPHDDADYVVAGNSRLGTPVDSTTSTCYEFPGRSLTIDSTFDGNRGLHFYTQNDASVKFRKLTLRGGVIALAYAHTTPQTIRGDVVVDLSDKTKPFRMKGGTAGQSWHFRDGSLSSGCDDVIETDAAYSVKSLDYWVHDDCDAAAFYGTFRTWWTKKLHVACPRFGGTAEAAATGVVSYAANGVSISNVWLSAQDAQLTFGADGYSDAADRLAMVAGTKVAFRAGTTLTVGQLDYQGGTLDFTKGGLLALTNGYVKTVPIELVVPLASTAKRSGTLVTMPVSAGELKPEDFTAAQIVASGCQYQFRIRVADGVQSLHLENLLPCGTSYSNYQNSKDFVHQVKGGYSGSSPVNIFADSEAWSNSVTGVHGVPVPGYDYEMTRMGYWGSADVDFQGDSLTYSGYPLRTTGNYTTYTFRDLRVISGASANYCPCFYTSAGKPNVTFNGMMTILCKATDPYPLYLSPCTKGKSTYGVFNMNMKIVGDATREFILKDYDSSTAVGEVTNVVKFAGDLSAYAGTIAVRANARMSLGGAATEMPGTLVFEDASARLTLEDVSASVGTVRTTAPALIEIPVGKTLTVTDALELADGTAVTMSAGEPALDLSACTQLTFGGTVGVSLAVANRSVKKAPVVLVKDMSDAETVMSAFRVRRNGQKPVELVAEELGDKVQISADMRSGMLLLFR